MRNARSAAEDFAAWAQGRDGLEPDVIDTLVEFKRTHLGDASDTRWTRRHLQQLLLEELPRAVTADDEWVGATVPTMRAYVRFLRDTGRLHRQADAASSLLEELDALEARYPAAMQERSRFGLTKSLAALAADDGVDLADEAVGAEWIEHFTARAFGEPAEAGPDDDAPPESVPAVRLPSQEVLAEAARSSALAGDVVRLASWVGRRRQVTQTGALRLEDAWAAVTELGLMPALLPDVDDEAAASLRPRLRTARDIGPLQMLWSVAVESGFVTVARTTACAGPALQLWEDGDDGDVLMVWRGLFAVVVELGVDYGLERRWQPPMLEHVEETVLGAFPSLYVGERSSVDQLIAELAEHLGVAGATFAEPLQSWADREVRDFVGRLADVGALTCEDGVVALTPLGRWAMREQLVEAGADAPVVGDVRVMDAAQMLAEVGRLWGEEAERARRDWLDSRAPAEAARDLVRAGCEGAALERIVVLSILDSDLSDAAEAALSAAVDHDRFGPHARMWLAEHAGADVGQQLTEEQSRSVALDGVAALLQALSPGCSPRDMPDELWPVAEMCLPAPGETPLGHEDAIQVYDAIGVGHPRGRVRKVAKKAAHQARKLALTSV
jgi:hypothetical protein